MNRPPLYQVQRQALAGDAEAARELGRRYVASCRRGLLTWGETYQARVAAAFTAGWNGEANPFPGGGNFGRPIRCAYYAGRDSRKAQQEVAAQ